MTTFIFQEVSLRATKYWVDAGGKKRQKTRKFCQTLNPFNKNADGSLKNKKQILHELAIQRDAWLKGEIG